MIAFPRTASIVLSVLLVSSGCSEPEPAAPVTDLALVDSLLSELGGVPTARLERGERWRMISSMGTGLPPAGFESSDLPDPDSRGAQLVKAYCVQCHWLPSPKMHTAAEWPVLVRRMVMRARTLRDRMGGPLATGMVGEVLMSGMSSTVVPSSEDADSLEAYLQRHALMAAAPGELVEGPGHDLFIEQCSACHETPSPAAHTAPEWNGVVVRMRANMAMMDVQPFTNEQSEEIAAYLRGLSGR